MNNVVGRFLRRFGIARHMIADVVFHQLAHEAVDGAARSRQALQDLRALLVFVESAEDTFKLADDFLGASDEVEFFAGGV